MKNGTVAVKLHQKKDVKKFNCTQCVLLSAKKYTNLDDETAYKIGEGFGGGIKSGEICGCLTGAVMVLGLCGQSKKTKYLIDDFKEKFGSCLCRRLKKTYKIPCDTLIEYEANKLEEVLKDGTL